MSRYSFTAGASIDIASSIKLFIRREIDALGLKNNAPIQFPKLNTQMLPIGADVEGDSESILNFANAVESRGLDSVSQAVSDGRLVLSEGK